MKLLNNLYIKITSWILVVSFLFVYILRDYSHAAVYVEYMAQNAVADLIDIPLEYGKVINRHIPKGKKAQVILIQDLHANYGVQKNIKNILDYLEKNYGISSIGVEGTSGNIDLSLINTIPDETVKDDVVEYFTSKGYITGPEWHAVNRNDLVLKGLENRDVYKQDSQLLVSSLNNRQYFVKTLQDIKQLLKEIESSACSKDFIKFNSQYMKYRQGVLSQADFHAHLSKWASRVNESINRISPEYSRFMILNSRLQELDIKKVEKEYKELLAELDLDNDASATLARTLKKFKNLMHTPAYIQKQITDKISSGGKYPSLISYIECAGISKSIDSYEIVKEEDKLIDTIAGCLCQDQKQKDLLYVSRYVQLVINFLLNQMTRDELARFFNDSEEFQSRLDRLCGSYPERCSMINQMLVDLEPYLKEMSAFFNIAKQRDSIFIDNFISGCDMTQRTNNVMITGGFHTQGVSGLLKDMDIPHIVIKPKVLSYTEEDRARYYSTIRGDRKLSLEEVFAYKLAPESFSVKEWFHSRILAGAVSSMMRKELSKDGYDVTDFKDKVNDFILRWLRLLGKVTKDTSKFRFWLNQPVVCADETVFPFSMGSQIMPVGVKGDTARIIPSKEALDMLEENMLLGAKRNLVKLEGYRSSKPEPFDLTDPVKAAMVSGMIKPMAMIEAISLQDMMQTIKERDTADENRSFEPLIPSPGSYILDNSDKTIEEALDEFESYMRYRLSEGSLDTVTVDGKVGSGKTAIGMALAKRLGYCFMDRGMMFRVAGYLMERMEKEGKTVGPADLIEEFEKLEIKFEQKDLVILSEGRDITGGLDNEIYGERATRMSAEHSSIIEYLSRRSAEIAKQTSHIVMAGQGISNSEFFPENRINIFIDAPIHVRAARKKLYHDINALDDVEDSAGWIEGFRDGLNLLESLKGYYIYDAQSVMDTFTGLQVFLDDKDKYENDLAGYLRDLIEKDDERLALLHGHTVLTGKKDEPFAPSGKLKKLMKIISEGLSGPADEQTAKYQDPTKTRSTGTKDRRSTREDGHIKNMLIVLLGLAAVIYAVPVDTIAPYVWDWYTAFLDAHPVYAKMLSTFTIVFFSDVVAQYVEALARLVFKKTPAADIKYSFRRSFKISTILTFMIGIGFHYWVRGLKYAFTPLEGLIPVNNLDILLAKGAFTAFVWAPAFYFIYLLLDTAVSKSSLSEVFSKDTLREGVASYKRSFPSWNL
ncbi:(d)CMP kinase, partial [Elusimicrobiota bacterium]